MKYLGLDWGKSKIGLAIGSDETKIASPILIEKKIDESFFEKLKYIIADEGIEKIILGKPVYFNSDNVVSAEFEKFLESLKQLGIEIVLEDERLTTKLVGSIRKNFEVKNDGADDDIAAAAILQSYLDKR